MGRLGALGEAQQIEEVMSRQHQETGYQALQPWLCWVRASSESLSAGSVLLRPLAPPDGRLRVGLGGRSRVNE